MPQLQPSSFRPTDPLVLHGHCRFVSSRARPARLAAWVAVAAWLVLTAIAEAALAPGAVSAQQLEVVSDENLRAGPNGERIGQLNAGTRVEQVSAEGDWREIAVEGWVWTRSLQTRNGGNFDLVVRADGGENLRDAPSGAVIGTLVNGALLEELERVTGWIHVRRRAWIWGRSVRAVRSSAARESAAGAAPAEPAAAEPVAQPRAESRRSTSATPAGVSSADLLAAATPLALRTAPDGSSLGQLEAGAPMRVQERRGRWARVLVEGWVPLADTAVIAAGEAADVSLTEVMRDPLRWRGRVVRWPLHFISLQEAEPIRREFTPGEPFLLTRHTETEGSPFVYVAIPPALLEQARTLPALADVIVTARIRSGAAELTGSPVLDLIELREETRR